MNQLVVSINGSTQAEIYQTAVKIAKAFFGDDADLQIDMDAHAVQTPDGQIRTFMAECTIKTDVKF